MPVDRESRKKIIHRLSCSYICASNDKEDKLKKAKKAIDSRGDFILTRQGASNTEDKTRKLAEIIVNKTLHVFQVSPLFRFSFQKAALNRLSRKIGLYVQKYIGEDTYGHGPGLTSDVEVDITRIKGFHNEIAGILLIIRRLDLQNDEITDKIMKEEFWGLLCKPSLSSRNDFTILSSNFTYLPLFLAKGRASLLHKVTTLLAQQFDCTIRRLNFSPMELSWLGAMWSGYEADIHRKPLEFVFMSPDSIDGITNISLKVDPISIADLWQRVHDENSDDFLLEELEIFMKSLETHFESAFKLNLAAFSLVEIHTTSLNAETSGTIKLFSPKTSPRILLHFSSLLRNQ